MTRFDSELERRLRVSGYLYDCWTSCGSHEAALAERFLDGSIAALEQYVKRSSQNKGRPQGGVGFRVDKVHVAKLTYQQFVDQYMQPNRPVLLEGTNDSWAATSDWTQADGSISLEFLQQNFGRSQIWATEIDNAVVGQGYGTGKRQDMTLTEYIAYWKRLKSGAEERVLYLKDWHFSSEFPQYKAYATPPFFKDDWLNDFFDMKQAGCEESKGRSQEQIITSDYRFVYLGPQGSWTPIHADVLRSFSWSTNVAGRKRWKLLAPEYTSLLMDRFGREMAPRFDLEELDEAAAERFPNLSQAAALAVEVEQGTNEALFVPSGWHHSVENLQDTLSINHNWLNGFNIHWGWEHLQEEYAGAAKAIEDCRSLLSPQEFEELVQRNIAANCGMNFFSMALFLGSIALRQIHRLQEVTNENIEAESDSLHQCLLVLQSLLSKLTRIFEPCKLMDIDTSIDSVAAEQCLNILQHTEDRTAFVSALFKLIECGKNRMTLAKGRANQ